MENIPPRFGCKDQMKSGSLKTKVKIFFLQNEQLVIAAKAEPISVIWRDYLKKCSVFEKWIQHPFT